MVEQSPAIKRRENRLISKYIEETASSGGARLKINGIHVWALVGYSEVVGGDLRTVARDYELPLPAVRAAMAYHRRNKEPIDARLILNRA